MIYYGKAFIVLVLLSYEIINLSPLPLEATVDYEQTYSVESNACACAKWGCELCYPPSPDWNKGCVKERIDIGAVKYNLVAYLDQGSRVNQCFFTDNEQFVRLKELLRNVVLVLRPMRIDDRSLRYYRVIDQEIAILTETMLATVFKKNHETSRYILCSDFFTADEKIALLFSSKGFFDAFKPIIKIMSLCNKDEIEKAFFNKRPLRLFFRSVFDLVINRGWIFWPGFQQDNEIQQYLVRAARVYQKCISSCVVKCDKGFIS